MLGEHVAVGARRVESVKPAPAARSGANDDGLPAQPWLLNRHEALSEPAGRLPLEDPFADTRVGRLLLGSHRRILWASHSVAVFLASGSPLRSNGGCLAANGRSNQTRLDALLEQAGRDDRRHDAFLAHTEGEPATIIVQAKGCMGGEGRVALQLRDLRADTPLELPDFASLYGLTPCEQRTLSLILNGLSVTDVAAKLHKSVLTVRTHVKRAYAKLGIGTKEQLFATIIRLG